jgi:DNA primase
MEKKLRILDLFNSLIPRGGIEAKGPELIFYCPFCEHHKRKLQINIDSQNWHCWVCDAKGRSVFSLAKKLNAPKQLYVELSEIYKNYKSTFFQKDESRVNKLPKEFQPLLSDKPASGITRKHALKYLHTRGITHADIARYNIGYCVDGDYGGRIIVPSYDNFGHLNYYVGRSIKPNYMKYKNPPVSKNIVVFDMYINWKMPIVLCEGVFDAIAIKRNAIPLLGKTISEALMSKIVFNRVPHVTIALDPDAMETSVRISQKLMKYGIKVFSANLEDGDPSDLGYKVMTQKIETATSIDSYELILQKIASGSI